MQLLLISNSTQYGGGYLDHCSEAIGHFLESRIRVLFVPFAIADWEAYTAQVRHRLKQQRLEVRGVQEWEDPRAALEWAEAVFIGGGNTFRLLDQLYRSGWLERVREAVRAGRPYIGSSAGSNVACPTIKTTNDMPIVYPPSFDALGLVSFQINPHYLDPAPQSRHQGETRAQRIGEFHEIHDVPVLGLREGCWLRREGPRLELGGTTPARLFRKGMDPEEYPPGSDLSFLLD